MNSIVSDCRKCCSKVSALENSSAEVQAAPVSTDTTVALKDSADISQQTTDLSNSRRDLSGKFLRVRIIKPYHHYPVNGWRMAVPIGHRKPLIFY